MGNVANLHSSLFGPANQGEGMPPLTCGGVLGQRERLTISHKLLLRTPRRRTAPRVPLTVALASSTSILALLFRSWVASPAPLGMYSHSTMKMGTNRNRTVVRLKHLLRNSDFVALQ